MATLQLITDAQAEQVRGGSDTNSHNKIKFDAPKLRRVNGSIAMIVGNNNTVS